MGMDGKRWIGMALLAVAMSGCAPPTISPQDKGLYTEFERERAAQAQAETAQPLIAPDTSMPMLQVIMTDQTSAGDVMLLRGKLRNPLYEKVTGARLILHVLSAARPGAKELETQQKEMSATIPSGGSVPLRWDIQSMYWGASLTGFRIEAYPKKVGDRVIPPPPDWKE
jgi:hypothetical protein